MRLFGQLTKIEDQPDGTLKVFGVASTGARDDEGEVVRPEAMKAALPDYARYPALREMHQPTAAGRTLEATVDDDGVTRIVAQVVDPVAIAKVKSRTYSGFSIGGRVLARDPGDSSVITKIKLTEISLVDRPANPEAVIDLWKAAAASPPSNDAVKARAAQLARSAGRPNAWKDYVAKARAALVSEQVATADDEDTDTSDAQLPSTAVADAPLASQSAQDDDAINGAGSDDDATDDSSSGDEDPAAIARQLAQLAGANPDALQAVHDALAALGATCHAHNVPNAAKGAGMGSFLGSADGGLVAAVLAKADALEHRLAAQDHLIQRIAATPLPPRTAASPHARAIGKADDIDPASDAADLSASDLEKAFAALTPDERAFLLMKASLRQPIPLP
jgi:HK97 family phage prohead protease